MENIGSGDGDIKKLISLGFVVVTPFKYKDRIDQSIPPIFYTPSFCLCDLYPNTDLLGWKQDAALISRYVELGLTPEQGAALSAWLQTLFDAKRWGYDLVFSHLEDAQEFSKRWGVGLPDIKILEMALPVSWLEKYLNAHILQGSSHTHHGRYFAALLNRLPVGRSFGFEVLGISQEGDDHTSACSDVRKDFHKGFNAEYTPYGFLTTLAQAELAAREYMFESDGFGIKGCDWFPIQVLEVQWTL